MSFPNCGFACTRRRRRPSDLRSVLRDWLANVGATEQETFDVTLACSEAFANAVGHPLRPATLIVDVEATVTTVACSR